MQNFNNRTLTGEAAGVLSKDELKQISAGVMPEEEMGGECRVALRNADGSWRGWSYRDYSVSQAQSWYSGHQTFSDGSYVSGYCCSSCPY